MYKISLSGLQKITKKAAHLLVSAFGQPMNFYIFYYRLTFVINKNFVALYPLTHRFEHYFLFIFQQGMHQYLFQVFYRDYFNIFAV